MSIEKELNNQVTDTPVQNHADAFKVEGFGAYYRIDQVQKLHLYMSDMVKFGEAKNGALLGINMALLYSVAIKYVSFANLLTSVVSITALTLLLLSILVLVISFLPRLYKPKAVNPISFVCINDINAEQFCQINSCQTSQEMIGYYSELISINAKVAAKKLREFKLAVSFSIPSYLAFAALYLLMS